MQSQPEDVNSILVAEFHIDFDGPDWKRGFEDGNSARPPRIRRIINPSYADGWIMGWLEHRRERTMLR